MIESSQNKNYLIWILGLLTVVSPFSIDLYLPAFSQIANDFHTETGRVSFSVSSYFIGMALGQLVYGPLLDRYGRKKPLYYGLVIFIITSIGCAFSTSVEMLIICRFLQALGGCVAWVASTAMVKDFFPADQSVKIFALLVLILGASPLLAPTVGGFMTTYLGWQAIFISLAVMGAVIILIVFLFLPEGHQPDTTVSLQLVPMLKNYLLVFKQPEFYTYTLSGTFSFATLFIYVAGSPIIFMEIFKVGPEMYGGIFAFLSIGFIGGSQLNIYLIKRFSGQAIFKFVLIVQVIVSIAFLVAAYNDWLEIYSVIGMLFLCLSCIGLINPNATVLALAPFKKNVGTASALLGCIQIGIAALASTGVGMFDSKNMIYIIALMAGTALFALLLLLIGKKNTEA